MPSLHRLEDAAERGRWLHFFANHELLATELMALVLLRFPQAPAAFRRGVLQTLKDEQEHTRLYIDRMRDCGIQFGQFPVSGYFWRAIAGMQNPMDYVSGLSLTFEQANLDFASSFARRFATVGDAKSAGLLEKIYRDEIAHVAYGLRWFRRWKNPHQTDWEAFCAQLKFPLSPSRAKGFVLNLSGRRAAGLDPAFIAHLDVYSQSKGRTPSVFWFNPFAEGYIAQGDSFTPSLKQNLLARDLENLPQFLCREDDIVLVEKQPSVDFLSGLKQAGFHLPEFGEVAKRGANDKIAQRKLGRLRPWAWSPDSLRQFAPLFSSVTGESRSPQQRFNPGSARLYSKAWSTEFLRRFLKEHPAQDWLCTEQEVGVLVETPEACWRAIQTIRARHHHRIIVKEALGLAGQNAMRLWEPELLESQRRWILRNLQRPHGLVVEPWLERVADFSVQLEMEPGGLKLCGFTGLLTDVKGQFEGNCAAANWSRRLPANVVDLWRGHAGLPGKIYQLYHLLFRRLEAALRQADFLGPVGIDGFAWRDSTGVIRLKPIVEINPRYTMGRLTLELMKRVAPGSQGCFRLIKTSTLHQQGFVTFEDYASALVERAPIVLHGEPVPRILEGALCLNDPRTAQTCLAVFEVSPGSDVRKDRG